MRLATGVLALSAVLSSSAVAQAQEWTAARLEAAAEVLSNSDRDTLGTDAMDQIVPAVYRYSIPADAPATDFTFRVASGEFDTLLELRDEFGNLLHENDDDPADPSSTNSRIVYPLLPGRTYYLVVGSFWDESGEFLIHAESDAMPLSPSALSEEIKAAMEPYRIECIRSLVDATRPAMVRNGVDRLHPTRFTRVREIWPNGRATVLSAASDSPARSLPFAEVDADSKLLVEFDHDALRQLAAAGRLEIGLLVSAEVVGNEGARPVEVPGYSRIGEQRRQSAARVRSLSAASRLLCPIVDEWNDHGARLRATFDLSMDATRRNKLIVNHLRVGLQLLLLRANQILDDNTFVAAGYVLSLSDQDSEALRSLARQTQQLGMQLSTRSPTTVDSLLPDQSLMLAMLWEQLAREAAALQGDVHGVGREELIELAISRIRDTEIILAHVGAGEGDLLVIRIENDVEGDSLPRTMQLRLRIREFGMRGGVRDAVALVHRSGVSEVGTQRLITSLRERAEAGATIDTTVALPANFLPTPGVTYGWTWYPRSVWSEGFTRFLRWLSPGVGINVSFPRFGTKRVQLTATQAATAEDGNGAPAMEIASTEVEEDADPINFGAGPVFSLFNEAVQFTIGWNLSVERKRFYYAVGFSFAEIIGSAVNKITAEDLRR